MSNAMEYSKLRNLGVGGVGSVDLIRSEGELYALKTISKKSDMFCPEHAYNEIRAGKLIKHSNVSATLRSWEDSNNMYLVMEFVGGWDLFGFIDTLGGVLLENTARDIFRQIVEALKFVHQKGVAHRDLKLDNIMIDYKRNAKIIDFGVCQTFHASRCSDRVGSPEYWAPEVVTCSRYNGFHADIWSLGIVLFAMLFGSFPFTPSELLRIKVGSPVRIPFGLSTTVSPAAKDLIANMLTTNPKNRFIIDEILQHPWLQE